jgi:hypothetical protein
VLSAAGHRVFLDTEGLTAGDPWPDVIRQAQQSSLLTVVLVSDRSDSAYFQKEEVVEAIKLAREEGIRRVVPVYLTGRSENRVRTPLRQLQGIFWEEGDSLLAVAQRIEEALKRSKKYEARPVDSATIVLVTGCDVWPELFDR